MNLDKNEFSWKRIALLLLIGIGILLLFPKLIGLKQIFELLKSVKYWAFILALFAESFFYIGSAILTRTVLRMTKDKLKFPDVLKISLLDSFSVQFLPLGTLGEGAVDYYFYRQKNIRTSHIFLMFIARTIIVYFIFAMIFLVGVAFSPTNQNINANTLLIVWIVYFAAFLLFFYLITLFFNKERLIKRVSGVSRLFNRTTKFLHIPQIPISRAPEFVDKFYQAVHLLFSNRSLQANAVLGASLFWFGDIFCLYFSFLGFGYVPHLAVVIFAYTIAKILSVASFIPGGLAITEGTLALIFIGFGIPAPTALAAILIFRFISFWITIPVGLGSFLSLQRDYGNMNLESKKVN